MSNSLLVPTSVTTWTQLVALGHPPGYIRAQLDARRWRRWGYAIVLHSGPLTQQERWHVARVHGGPGALLTAFTAVEAYGLRGWEREPVHVLSRPHTHHSGRSPVPLRVHTVRDWSRARRDRSGPVHFLPQAVLVAAASFDSPRPACGLLAACVQQRLLTPDQLFDVLADAPRLKHRAALRAAMQDVAQGSEALSEIDFVKLCRRHHLPPPIRQAVRHEPSGRRRYLDACWRRSDGRLVVVEVDGALHLSARQWWDDQLRQNEITLGDAIVLRFPSVVVRTQPELVAAQIRRALAI